MSTDILTSFQFIDADLNDGSSESSVSNLDSKWGMYTIKVIGRYCGLCLIDRNLVLVWDDYNVMQADLRKNDWKRFIRQYPINSSKKMDFSYLPCKLNEKMLRL
jgi:hypothetical protein